MRPGFTRRRGLWLASIVVALLVIGGVAAAIVITQGGGSSGSGTATTATATAPGTTSPAASVSAAVSTAVASIARASAIVPSIVGEPQSAAEARLHNLGFDALARTQASSRPGGIVLSQTPAGGTRLEHGALVGLVVSAGPQTAGMPAVVGLPVADALAKVRAAGLEARTKPVRANLRAGLVSAQSPAAGARPTSGPVVLSVSLGPANVKVPNVVGSLRAAAVQTLVQAGFTVSFKAVPSQRPAGTVLAQSPSAGATAPHGSTVRLRVVARASAGPAGSTTAVPDVTGRQKAAAEAILQAAGLGAHAVQVKSLLLVGTVVRQSPAAGAPVAAGSSVTLSVSSGPGP